MRLLALCAVLGLASCGDVMYYNIDQAKKFCTPFGGVYRIEANETAAVCMSGLRVNWRNAKRTDEQPDK